MLTAGLGMEPLIFWPVGDLPTSRATNISLCIKSVDVSSQNKVVDSDWQHMTTKQPAEREIRPFRSIWGVFIQNQMTQLIIRMQVAAFVVGSLYLRWRRGCKNVIVYWTKLSHLITDSTWLILDSLCPRPYSWKQNYTNRIGNSWWLNQFCVSFHSLTPKHSFNFRDNRDKWSLGDAENVFHSFFFLFFRLVFSRA